MTNLPGITLVLQRSYTCPFHRFKTTQVGSWNQVRIQDLVKGGRGQLLRSKVSDIAKWSLCEQSEPFVAGVQGLLKSPGSFWVFNAQTCNLPHSRDSFSLIFDSSTPKTDKNSTSHCTSINLRYFCILHPIFNLHEKVLPLIV